MTRYLWIILLAVSCQSPPRGEAVVSRQLEEAIKNGDTALAKKMAQQELDNIRSSITDSSFAALMDAMLAVEQLQFKIQQADTVPEDGYLKKLHAVMNRVYKFALDRSKQQKDRDYYAGKVASTAGVWINNNFSNKTKKQLRLSALLLQKDIAVASGIINGIDTKEMREQTERSYDNSIKLLE